VFWVSDQQCTAAELTKEEKNKISHRGQATQALLDKIELIKASMA
ncbi:non-canonical purine NTP pyrophosphatase, partial [Oleiphilus sp. HI0061]